MSMRLLLAPALLARVLPALVAAGCAPTGTGYPSLLPRAAENQSFAEPAAPPPAPMQADPALDARIAAALRSLDERIAAFDAAAAQATRRIATASSSPAGSAAWLDAQIALADLDSARSATAEIGGTLDDMAGERATALQPEYPALDAAVAKARAAGEAQRATIARLQDRLAPA